MSYAPIGKVRKRIQGFSSQEVRDGLIDEGLCSAQVIIDAKLQACGFTVPFDKENVPGIICYISAEWAAGWVLTRPQFSSCTDAAPENGKLWMEEAGKLLQKVCDGELSLVGSPQSFGVLSSTDDKFKERIKQFSLYNEPVCTDKRPVINPEFGELSNYTEPGVYPEESHYWNG